MIGYCNCQKLCPFGPHRLRCHACIAHPSFPRKREPGKSRGTRDRIPAFAGMTKHRAAESDKNPGNCYITPITLTKAGAPHKPAG
jgi:hypothetical protein